MKRSEELTQVPGRRVSRNSALPLCCLTPRKTFEKLLPRYLALGRIFSIAIYSALDSLVIQRSLRSQEIAHRTLHVLKTPLFLKNGERF